MWDQKLKKKKKATTFILIYSFNFKYLNSYTIFSIHFNDYFRVIIVLWLPVYSFTYFTLVTFRIKITDFDTIDIIILCVYKVDIFCLWNYTYFIMSLLFAMELNKKLSQIVLVLWTWKIPAPKSIWVLAKMQKEILDKRCNTTENNHVT